MAITMIYVYEIEALSVMLSLNFPHGMVSHTIYYCICSFEG